MWRCATCGERLEDQFEVCWSCGSERAPADPGAPAAQEPEPAPLPEPRCVDCREPLEDLGAVLLRVVAPGGEHRFPHLYEREAERWPVRVQRCANCGRLAFFSLGEDEE